MKKIYKYFISYTGSLGKSTVAGNLRTTTNYKIKDIEQIRVIEKGIAKDNNLDKVVINHFILLGKEFGKLEDLNDKS